MDARITEAQIASLIPITHLSPSAVMDFTEDRRKFRKKWIDLDFGGKLPQSMAEGTMYHAGLELYWKRVIAKESMEDVVDGMVAAAVDKLAAGREEVEFKWSAIPAKDVADAQANGQEVEKRLTKSGKTQWYAKGSHSQMKALMERLFADYVALSPTAYGVCLAAEERAMSLTEDVDTGRKHLLPLKGRIDRVDWDEATGTLTLIDYKCQASDPKIDENDAIVVPARWVAQGSGYESLAAAVADVYGLTDAWKNTRVIFEVTNKKNMTRTHVEVAIGQKERLAWSRLYRGVYMSLALASFLPDGADPYLPSTAPTLSGETEGWDAFMEDIAVELGEAEPRTIAKLADVEALEM
jgi:hypothetical protein